MAAARNKLVALLAVLGLLMVVLPAAGRANCPMKVSMMHHQQRAPAPMNRDLPCTACTAVLPLLSLIEGLVRSPVAQFTDRPGSLYGINPALDPPPPRGA